MAYQALARKWRPRKFAEIVGQEHVVRALMHALEADRLHHAYLFTGTRGVGKTTLARLLAKAMNCEHPAGGEPCGACSHCRQLDEGRFVDLVEVDAASRTKVEDTRDLMENVLYAPSQGRYKVYLIDEVHMLSMHSFNALLKTLEEPPPHVKFLLATTDPQKIPVTVLSRCLQFNLKRLTVDLIRGQMEAVLLEEHVPHEANAIRALARAADGSLRDGLSLLDQAIAYGGGSLSEAGVLGMLGTVSRAPVFDLLDALLDQDAARILDVVDEMDAHAPDYPDVLQHCLVILHHAALAQWVPETLRREDDAERILALSQKTSAEELQLFYQIGLIGQRDLPLAPDPRSGFEMVMLRMMAFRPRSLRKAESAKRTDLERPTAGTIASVSPPEKPHTPPQASLAATMARAQAESPAHSGQQPVATIQAPSAPPQPAPVSHSAATEKRDWGQLIEAMGLTGMARELANNSVLLGLRQEVCHIRLEARHEHLKSPRSESNLVQALTRLLGHPVTLQIDIGAPEGETPARQSQRQQDAMDTAIRAAIEGDEVIETIKNLFDAELVPGSVKPIAADAAQPAPHSKPNSETS